MLSFKRYFRRQKSLEKSSYAFQEKISYFFVSIMTLIENCESFWPGHCRDFAINCWWNWLRVAQYCLIITTKFYQRMQVGTCISSSKIITYNVQDFERRVEKTNKTLWMHEWWRRPIKKSLDCRRFCCSKK